jgi:hypothetical protein
MEKTINYSEIVDVVQEAVDKTFNAVCQKKIISGEVSGVLRDQLNFEGQLYLINILEVLKANGINVEFPKEEKNGR